MADAQDMLSGIGSGEQVVNNTPTEEQAVKAAIGEVLASDAAEAEAKSAKAAEDKEKKAAAAADEAATQAESGGEADPLKAVVEADKIAAEAKEAAAKEKADKEAKDAKSASTKRDLELAERMGKLANQERKLLKEREDFKRTSDAFEARAKAAETETAKYKEIAELLEKNPYKAYRMLGKDFSKGAKRALEITQNPNSSIQDQIEAQEARFDKRLADERAAREKEKQEEQERYRTATEEQDRSNTVLHVTQVVEKSGEKYELIRAEGREKDIALELWNHWKATGEVVQMDDYLAHVEAELEKKLEERILKTTKAKKRMVPGTTAAIVADKAKAEAAKAAVAVENEDDDKEDENEPIEKTIKRERKKLRRTLTNSASTRAAPPPKRESTGDAWADARAEALAMLEG